jgi:hypothetical protein
MSQSPTAEVRLMAVRSADDSNRRNIHCMGEPGMPVTEPSWDLLPMLICQGETGTSVANTDQAIMARPIWLQTYGHWHNLIHERSHANWDLPLGRNANVLHKSPLWSLAA